MQIKTTTQANEIFLSISGRIDSTNAQELTEACAQVEFDKIEKLVMDFAEVAYISSAGLRSLLVIRKKAGSGKFFVANVNSSVEDIFVTTGFSAILDYSAAEESLSQDCSVAKDAPAVENMSFKAFLAYKQEYGVKTPILQLADRSLTWQDIEVGSQIIAEDLSKLGVKRGSHVAIGGRNSLNWVLTFFAVQKLGAIAMLMNFNLTIDEIIRMSHSADITHLCYGKMNAITDEEQFKTAVTGEESLIDYMYDIGNHIDFFARANEYEATKDKHRGSVESDDVAVMIFTSGSTGNPKAVMLSASNILSSAKVQADDLRLSAADISCMVSPMFHISGLGGGLIGNMIYDTKVLLPSSVKPNIILELLEKEKCSVFNAVPTMMFSIVDHPEFSSEKVKNLRYSKLAGAPITEAQCKILQEKMPANHFVASYGMSEIAPITCTLYEDTVQHIISTVGKPVKNVQLKIVNPANGEECAIGVSGEILVRGTNQMLGYYKLAVDSQAIDSDGWLHTGDLGKFDEDGYVYFTGRAKELIIRAGENISPNEIAAVLTEKDEIADAKVFGIPDDFYGEIVGAALLTKEGCAFDEEAIREHVKTRLAKFKWPEHYVVYEQFPLLSNGKIDGVSLKKDFIKRIMER